MKNVERWKVQAKEIFFYNKWKKKHVKLENFTKNKKRLQILTLQNKVTTR